MPLTITRAGQKDGTGKSTIAKPSTGIVERSGRLHADGSRHGARTLRRLTVYLSPELAKRLTLHAVEHDRTMSDLIADALDAHLGEG